MPNFGYIAASINRARNNETSRTDRHERIDQLKKVFIEDRSVYQPGPLKDKSLTRKELAMIKKRIRADVDKQKQRRILLLIPISLIIFTLLAYAIFWAFYIN